MGSQATGFDPAAFKAYDIRGTYPDQVSEASAYALGLAYVERFRPRTVAVGCDARTSSPSLKEALIEGLRDAGADVTDIGGVSTEMLYFAVGQFGYDGGIIVTASHNPAQYNGFKLVKAGAEPISRETGIEELREMMPAFLRRERGSNGARGRLAEREVLEEYRSFLLGFIDPKLVRPARIVANANFGFQGRIATRLLEGLPITLDLLNGEPDGRFPKGQPDPFLPANRTEFVERVSAVRPALGVTWDADGDRVFFAAGDGTFVEAYYTAAILAQAMLRRQPGQKVVYDVRYTWAVIDAVAAAGGESIRSRVGHSYIKQSLRQHNALFCGEASGHVYFRDYFFADSGILPLLLMLELLGASETSLSALVQPLLDRYFISGEINTRVADPAVVIAALKEQYGTVGTVDELDGLTIECGREWRFNVRVSNTESLLRLNVEASSQALMEDKRDELVRLIGSYGTR